MESNVGPSAWMRSCTAFCAPLPSATIVMTAPTPMMMPSIVRNDRSLLARIAWSATWKISSSSMLRPRRRRLPRRRRGLLLLHARQATDVPHPLLHVALRIEQRRAWQHQHRVLLRQTAHDLDEVEIGETGADLHRGRLAVLEDEDDVARGLARVAVETATTRPAPTPPPAAAAAERSGGTHRGEQGAPRGLLLLSRRLSLHPLVHGGLAKFHLRRRKASRCRHRTPVGQSDHEGDLSVRGVA